MESGLKAMGAHRVPMGLLGRYEELELAFTNVNQVDRAAEVEKILRAAAAGRGRQYDS